MQLRAGNGIVRPLQTAFTADTDFSAFAFIHQFVLPLIEFLKGTVVALLQQVDELTAR